VDTQKLPATQDAQRHAVVGKGAIIRDSHGDAPVELVGGKGRSLLRVKALGDLSDFAVKISVPQFAIVSPEVNLNDNFTNITSAARSFGVDSFAVRSSYKQEDVGEHTFDGIFDTKLGVPSEKVVQAVGEVRKSAITEKSKKYALEKGIELEDNMPVIIQAMVVDPQVSGVIYSKFPCPNDVVKVITFGWDGSEDIDVWARKLGDYNNINLNPVVNSERFSKTDWGIKQFIGKIINIEQAFGYPIISEFAYNFEVSKDQIDEAFILQARKLTRLADSEKFKIPALQEEGLVGKSKHLSGVGDVTGETFVLERREGIILWEDVLKLKDFDETHKNGYVLVTPYLQFYNDDNIDSSSPNKKAVVAYSDLGRHHDFELARTSGILYLGFGLQTRINVNTLINCTEYDEKPLIKTGDKIRVVSDGISGFVYNLSK